MTEWTQCPSCLLKHAVRPDGLCPRCRHPTSSATPGSTSGPPAQRAEPEFAILASPPPAGNVGWGAADPAAAVPLPTIQPAYVVAPNAFTVGKFVSAVFATWGRTAGLVIPIALLTYAPLALVMYRLYSGMQSGSQPEPRQLLVGFGAIFAILVVLAPVQLLATARAGVRQLERQPVELGDMLGVSMRFFFPVLGLLFLVGLAYLGTACTIAIPMVLLTGWAASVPALITEGLGPVEAMKRSWQLSRGLRWQVFAGFLVVILILFAAYCMIQSVLMGFVVAAGVRAGAEAGGSPGVNLGAIQAINMLMSGLQNSFMTIGTAVAYHQLRVATEGPPSENLGRVFE